MAERWRVDREEIRVETAGNVRDTEDVATTESIRGVEEIRTTAEVRGGAPSRRAEDMGSTEGPPPEDEEVNPVGSYESWDQTGQSLDAAGAGMTGDSGSIGLTGTGFEDDTEIRSPGKPDAGEGKAR